LPVVKIELGTDGDQALVREHLIDFNRKRLPEHADTPYGKVTFVVKDDNGHAQGGIAAHYHWGRMQIDFLWIDEQIRQRGIGKELLAKIENYAIEKDCTLLLLDTFSFQAPDFYIKYGFSVFGMIENHPTGHHQYFLQKRIGEYTESK
jgi:ribosomal protein S18 acetylase RimI-like enzyme